ncbi:MAG: AI-2E family transporter [Verrucomicrobiales bacterium]|nr:AI-2E family transporter [Verrucomicrobiales bacterium]
MNGIQTSPTPGAESGDWSSRSSLGTVVLIAATALGLFLCYQLAHPFLASLAWALALAVIFAPFQGWLEKWIKSPSVAALIAVAVVGLMVAIPISFVGQRLLVEAAGGAEMIKSKLSSGEWQKAVEAQPRIAPIARWIEAKVDLPGTFRLLSSGLTNVAGYVVRGSIVQAMSFALTFYLLFFLLRDRRDALRALSSLIPLTEFEMDRLLTQVGNTIFATVYGTLAVSAIQGLLGGLMFWWLGLPTPLLWGVVMALLAVVPVLGAFVVWIPAALFLLLEGSWGKALILALWGGLLVGTVDNLLRPVLVGKRLKLHTVLVFMSVVGGLVFLGPAGLILGPIILTVTFVLLETWRLRVSPDSSREVSAGDISRFENEGGKIGPIDTGRKQAVGNGSGDVLPAEHADHTDRRRDLHGPCRLTLLLF